MKNVFGAVAAVALSGAMMTAQVAKADDHGKGKADGAGWCKNESCKGKSACKGHGNDNCKGMNECKGHGHLEAADAKACKAAGGKWMAKK